MASAGFSEKLRKLFGGKPRLDNVFFEDVADRLVEGDLAPSEAFDLADRLEAVCKKQGISEGELALQALADMMREDMKKAHQHESSLVPDTLTIILLLGVNGVGKTSTTAKLAYWYRAQEATEAVLAAADTFRAAAIEQLCIHGERLNMRVVAHKQGGDPAAVVFDAIETCQARGKQLLIADTAGRMHTKSALVEELRKIDRIVQQKAENAVYRKYLVLDATTGRNALSQAEVFNEAVKLDGIVMTKYDSSAKGGAAYSLARQHGLPVVFLGFGEAHEHLKPFDTDSYLRDFLGL